MNLSKNTNANVIKMNPIIVPKVFLAINLPIIPKNDIKPIFWKKVIFLKVNPDENIIGGKMIAKNI